MDECLSSGPLVSVPTDIHTHYVQPALAPGGVLYSTTLTRGTVVTLPCVGAADAGSRRCLVASIRGPIGALSMEFGQVHALPTASVTVVLGGSSNVPVPHAANEKARSELAHARHETVAMGRAMCALLTSPPPGSSADGDEKDEVPRPPPAQAHGEYRECVSEVLASVMRQAHEYLLPTRADRLQLLFDLLSLTLSSHPSQSWLDAMLLDMLNPSSTTTAPTLHPHCASFLFFPRTSCDYRAPLQVGATQPRALIFDLSMCVAHIENTTDLTEADANPLWQLWAAVDVSLHGTVSSADYRRWLQAPGGKTGPISALTFFQDRLGADDGDVPHKRVGFWEFAKHVLANEFRVALAVPVWANQVTGAVVDSESLIAAFSHSELASGDGLAAKVLDMLFQLADHHGSDRVQQERSSWAQACLTMLLQHLIGVRHFERAEVYCACVMNS